jgi:hypothetical protein
MSIEVMIDSDAAVLVARPPYGKPVTFVVEEREIDVARNTGSWYQRRTARRFVVGLKGGTRTGFSHHTSFELAVTRAMSRARRYDRAYSVPRGMLAKGAAA